MVKRPLAFSLESLMRYPMETRIHFVECAGNSGAFSSPQPPQITSGELNGLLSCSEWTGVRLSTLLADAGVAKEAKWVIAEGADAAAMSRSIPLEKCMDDAMIALYQNGEAIRPEQGFPMRLLLPGFEGNMNVKWLRRLNVTDAPVDARDETSHYTELMPSGKARQFMFLQRAKSAIVKPSLGMTMKGPGLYEVSGLAWSGAGRISKVEVSADGGKTWAPAALNEPVLSKALTRFRLPWKWDGQPAALMSRATDEMGGTQPTRASWIAEYAPGQGYHFNGIQIWSVEADGTVKNVYA
jgi:sulfane dehydrogenase subunit SoxC